MTTVVMLPGTVRKAYIVFEDNNPNQPKLFSYDTHVATFDIITFDWVWITDNPKHLSQTTRRHINTTARGYNLPEYKEWRNRTKLVSTTEDRK